MRRRSGGQQRQAGATRFGGGIEREAALLSLGYDIGLRVFVGCKVHSGRSTFRLLKSVGW